MTTAVGIWTPNVFGIQMVGGLFGFGLIWYSNGSDYPGPLRAFINDVMGHGGTSTCNFT